MIKKVSELILSLFLLSFVSFMMMKLLPGSPFETEVTMSSEVYQVLDQKWKLQEPLHIQYLNYTRQLFTGDWGFSVQNPQSNIADQLLASAQSTLRLAALALLLVIFLVLALFLFLRTETQKKMLKQYNFVVLSLPTLFLGPFLIWIFSIQLGWLPLAFLSSPLHFVLPVLILSLRPTSQLLELLYLREKEEQGADYLRTARAKGISEHKVRLFHLFPNILIPVVAYVPQLIMGLISGSFLVEVFFSAPGLGTEILRALEARDAAILVFMTTLLGFLWVILSLVTDLILKVIDPRLQGKV